MSLVSKLEKQSGHFFNNLSRKIWASESFISKMKAVQNAAKKNPSEKNEAIKILTASTALAVFEIRSTSGISLRISSMKHMSIALSEIFSCHANPFELVADLVNRAAIEILKWEEDKCLVDYCFQVQLITSRIEEEGLYHSRVKKTIRTTLTNRLSNGVIDLVIAYLPTRGATFETFKTKVYRDKLTFLCAHEEDENVLVNAIKNGDSQQVENLYNNDRNLRFPTMYKHPFLLAALSGCDQSILKVTLKFIPDPKTDRLKSLHQLFKEDNNVKHFVRNLRLHPMIINLSETIQELRLTAIANETLISSNTYHLAFIEMYEIARTELEWYVPSRLLDPLIAEEKRLSAGKNHHCQIS